MKSETTRLSNFSLVFGTLLILGVLVTYWPVLVNLFDQLTTDEDFSYGLLLPFVSAYLVYLKWPDLRREPWRPNWLGLAVMTMALGLYLGGKLAAEFYSTRVSFPLFIAGILLLTGGWRILRLLAFPLFLLLLMLPLPGILTSTLTLPLQLISSRLAALFLRALGYPLVLQGNVIDLGVRQLQVVAACSGLRYILSLLALGIIFCYFYQRRLWKATLLIISLIPTSIFANAARVAAMGIFPSLQEGFLHSFTGWLIFIFCFAVLGLLNWVLNHLEPQTQEPAPAQNSPDISTKPPSRGFASYSPFLIAGLVMIGLAGTLIYTVGSPPRIPLLQSFDQFPLQLGSWQGSRGYMSSEIFEKTDADAYFEADYASPNKESVNFYIAYYEKQTKPGGLAHNPGVCMTGIGWKTLASGLKDIAPGLTVHYLVVQKETMGPPLLVYYWNIHQGQWLALQGARLYKLMTIYNAIRFKRSDWALIRLITPVVDNFEAANNRLTSFAHLLLPVFPKFMLTTVPEGPTNAASQNVTTLEGQNQFINK